MVAAPGGTCNSCRLQRALNAGSSKQGKTRRASAASNWVTATGPARYRPRRPGENLPRQARSTTAVPAGTSSSNERVTVSLCASRGRRKSLPSAKGHLRKWPEVVPHPERNGGSRRDDRLAGGSDARVPRPGARPAAKVAPVKRVLIVQHEPFEGPGTLREALSR